MVLEGGKRKEQGHLFMRLVQFKYYEQLIQPTQVAQHPFAVCKLCPINRDAEIDILKTYLCKM
jgi:lysyl-tRNA synthetase class II